MPRTQSKLGLTVDGNYSQPEVFLEQSLGNGPFHSFSSVPRWLSGSHPGDQGVRGSSPRDTVQAQGIRVFTQVEVDGVLQPGGWCSHWGPKAAGCLGISSVLGSG